MSPFLSILLTIVQILIKEAPATTQPMAAGNGNHQQPSTITIRIKNAANMPDPLFISRAEMIGQERRWDTVTGTLKDGEATFVITTEEPQYLQLSSISKEARYQSLLLEPGDDITFFHQSGILQATGIGAAKYELLTRLQRFRQSLPRPSNPKDYLTHSIADYIEWDSYLNTLLKGQDSLLTACKPQLSDYTYNLLRALTIDQNIDDRSDKFHSLVYSLPRKQYISSDTLCRIYDSLYYPATSKGFDFCSRVIYGNWKPLLFKVLRQYNFNWSTPPLNTKQDTWILCYQLGIDHYKGIIREQFITDFLYKHLLKEYGFTPQLEQYLRDYYATSQSEERRQYMRTKEQNLRRIINSRKAPAFELEDVHGAKFNSEQLANKLAIFEFWFTGCAGCIQTAQTIKKAEQHFKEDTNIVFIKVSIDKDRASWLQSIKKERYTTPGGIHLYTQGQQDDHLFIVQTDITGYPSIVFFDAYGRMLPSNIQPPSLRSNPDSLIDYIETLRLHQQDGPHLFRYSKDSLLSITTKFNSTDSGIIHSRQKIQVATDQPGKYFFPEVREQPAPEPSYFGPVAKIFALSDIEGNFSALRKLLTGNQVIDSNLNWSFGNGHLVICGDVFDRGEQVTECLWLIYQLEKQAKEKGGYVHFILGNHDVMNLQGNLVYAQEKYKRLAGSLGKDGHSLYSPQSILGQWIRTKNVMEQIGTDLFVHGGIGLEFSDQVAKPDLATINRQFRSMMDTKWMSIPRSDTLAVHLFHPETGPLWYRKYYEATERLQFGNDTTTAFSVAHPSQNDYQHILQKWKVSKIITGHTIVADTISISYENQLINLDTKHSAGKSEALLIENNIYYRTNGRGDKRILFKQHPYGGPYNRIPVSKEQ